MMTCLIVSVNLEPNPKFPPTPLIPLIPPVKWVGVQVIVWSVGLILLLLIITLVVSFALPTLGFLMILPTLFYMMKSLIVVVSLVGKENKLLAHLVNLANKIVIVIMVNPSNAL
eukprot:Lithocolla_globosa_v1_NODE_7920_length_887_cov_3.110577.p3 type:complete len:114 gc:universal NODE_7920_length_887_cov_3.110577:130-471(+)